MFAHARAASTLHLPTPSHLFSTAELPPILTLKIETISREVYGAASVTYSDEAERTITAYTAAGYGNLPICMAKTHLSLSTDASLKGVPTGFNVHVREIRASVGAGYLYPLLGTIMTLPGLPIRPGFVDIDLDKDGRITGLF